MKNQTSQGLTLLELLIAIAIIGILAAVLIPNVINIRKRAMDTAAEVYAKDIMEGMAAAIAENNTRAYDCENAEYGCFYNTDRADCFSIWLLQQGLPDELPRGVADCSLEYEVERGYTIITVVSATGKVITKNF